MTNGQAAIALFFMGIIALCSAILGGDRTVWLVAVILFLMSAWQASYIQRK